MNNGFIYLSIQHEVANANFLDCDNTTILKIPSGHC